MKRFHPVVGRVYLFNNDFPREEKAPHQCHRNWYHCACIACNTWRMSWVCLGDTVVSAVAAPRLMWALPEFRFCWKPGTWGNSDSKIIIDPRIYGLSGLVLGKVDRSDRANGGHLDCVYLLWENGSIIVTRAGWILSLSTPTADEYFDQIEVVNKAEDVRRIKIKFDQLLNSYSDIWYKSEIEKDLGKQAVVNFYNSFANDLLMQKDLRTVLKNHANVYLPEIG